MSDAPLTISQMIVQVCLFLFAAIATFGGSDISFPSCSFHSS